MSKRRPRPVLTSDLGRHPSVVAWRELTGLDATPTSIRVRRERPSSSVYRMDGPDFADGAVYAKRVPRAEVEIERIVYERILPRLPLTVPRYFGVLLDDTHGWIFVEDVGEQRYSKHDAEHLKMAARWVATLHLGAAELPDARSLPDGGPTRYLEHLRSGRRKIVASLDAWPYPSEEAEILTSVLRELDAVESGWPRIEASCRDAPVTVVHGDFRPKNAYLRPHGTGASLYPIDWETAGFGPPNMDLRRIHLDTYWSLVRETWVGLSFGRLERLARVGRLLGTVAAVDWEAATLESRKPEARSASTAQLDDYRARLEQVGGLAGVYG